LDYLRFRNLANSYKPPVMTSRTKWRKKNIITPWLYLNRINTAL